MNYRMGSVIWRSRVGPGRIGRIHGEAFLLQRIEENIGFRWTATRRRTGEKWKGCHLVVLVRQIWIDLHSENYEDDDPSIPDELEDCNICRVGKFSEDAS